MRDFSRRAKVVANFALFQFLWFWCVLAPAWWDVAVGVLVIGAHLRFIGARGEWRILASVAIAGATLDSLLSAAGILRFEPESALAPLWLILLWLNFATTLSHAMRWLAPYRLWSAVFGAVFAPPAYWAAAALTDKAEIAVSFPVFAAVHAPLWAVFTPAAFYIAGLLNKNQARG